MRVRVCSFPSDSDSRRRASGRSSLEGNLLGVTVSLHRGTKDWDSRPVRLASSFVWRRVARKEAGRGRCFVDRFRIPSAAWVGTFGLLEGGAVRT